MQKKSYYRWLKWTLLGCVTASFASACVVTTDGDGDGHFFDGGDSNSGTSGKTSNEGGDGSTTAGTSATGGGGSSSTAGTGGAGSSTGGTTSAGTGGTDTTPAEEVGLCQDDDNPEPTLLPSCAPDDKDELNACRKCQRASCCSEWRTCYGDTPRIACGWGADPADDYEGQFDCITRCYDEKIAADPSLDQSEILEDCSFECLKQCDSDGLVMDATSNLVDCSVNHCNDECFPPPM